MWLKLSQRDFVGITFCRQRFYRDRLLLGMCLTGAERDQVQGGGNGPGAAMLECTEIQQVASWVAAGLKAHAKNSLRLSSPLAKNVWLVNFRENPEPLARLVSAATQHRFRYGIAAGRCGGCSRRTGHDKKFLDRVRVGEQFKREPGWRTDALEAVSRRVSSFALPVCLGENHLCRAITGRLTTSAIRLDTFKKDVRSKPILSQRRWIKCYLPILVWQQFQRKRVRY